MSDSEILLEVKNLKTQFFTEDGVVKAVDDISFYIRQGEVLGLVGESGCGKTVSSLSVLRLVPDPPGKIVGGEVLFRGENLLEKNDNEMRHIRGNEISMIFQDPMSSLNPVFTVKNQLLENIKLHQDVTSEEALQKGIEMLELVGIGMRQRVMIAMALSCNPSMVIADEPTTALDVTIQAQVLDLMRDLREDLNMAILYITHNLGVIAEMADRIAVMYAGNIVETADTITIFKTPHHPYTKALLSSIPRMDKKLDRLGVIKGTVPNLITPPTGCRFHPRCPIATEKCSREVPPLVETEPDHFALCHYPG